MAMQTLQSKRPVLRSLGTLRRRKISVSEESIVKVGSLFSDSRLPLLVEPRSREVDIIGWAESRKDWLEEKLRSHGGILFRGFDVDSIEKFEEFIRCTSGALLEYKERSSPRTAVKGSIYTSTDYPPEQEIFLHNENSYQSTWPMKIFFYAVKTADSGGETPIADCRNVYQKVDPAIRRRFEEKGWMYQRNFGDGFGLPWQVVFQTDDPAVVEAHCKASGIELEWKEGNRLRVHAVRPAVSRHPKTGEPVWFNHATFFHVSTLAPSIRKALEKNMEEKDFPTHSYYGDDTPIELSVLDHLRQIYAEETVRFPWREGDVLMLDNMMAAHGRGSFTGERKVVVGMAEPLSWRELQSLNSDDREP